MSLFRIMDIGASGLTAQRIRMQVVSANLANAETTRTADGGPFRRRIVTFTAAGGDPDRFSEALSRKLTGVHVSSVELDDAPPVLRYQPGHPDADARGYVSYPNINLSAEMADLMSSVRSYQANLTVIRSVRTLFRQTLDLLR
ncbi:MAG: flagellar basal body rod protein FlgC [Acidobacteriota bacterium]